jgi:transcriptional regulator with XRE-family HTH domain
VPKLTTPIDEDFSALPERIALAIKQSGLTQRKAAEAAGIQQSAISRVDSDRLGGVSANQLVRLAKALSVRVGWLLVGEEPMRPQKGSVAMPLVFIEKPADAHDERARPKRNRK